MTDELTNSPIPVRETQTAESSPPKTPRAPTLPSDARDTPTHPHTLDLALLAVGSALTGLGIDMFSGAFLLASIGLAVGCASALAAWIWSRRVAPVLILVAVAVVASAILYAFYTLLSAQSLVAAWGAFSYVVGTSGVTLTRKRDADRARRVTFEALMLGVVGALMLTYFLAAWPLEGRTMLLDLSMAKQANVHDARPEAGGIWSAYWGTSRVPSRAAVENIETQLAADGWSFVSANSDTSPIVSAQRGDYSLEVLYDPDANHRYWPTGATMSAYVRRGPARRFDYVP